MRNKKLGIIVAILGGSYLFYKAMRKYVDWILEQPDNLGKIEGLSKEKKNVKRRTDKVNIDGKRKK